MGKEYTVFGITNFFKPIDLEKLMLVMESLDGTGLTFSEKDGMIKLHYLTKIDDATFSYFPIDFNLILDLNGINIWQSIQPHIPLDQYFSYYQVAFDQFNEAFTRIIEIFNGHVKEELIQMSWGKKIKRTFKSGYQDKNLQISGCW